MNTTYIRLFVAKGKIYIGRSFVAKRKIYWYSKQIYFSQKFKYAKGFSFHTIFTLNTWHFEYPSTGYQVHHDPGVYDP